MMRWIGKNKKRIRITERPPTTYHLQPPMLSLLKKTWKIKTPGDSLPLLERVCMHRDLDPKDELTELHSPWSLKDINKAVERVQKAIRNGERIMIFGDYDVDGVSGASILYLGLKELRAEVSVRL
ncbi:MAG: hypothetical protein U1C97_02245, partial [Candidatus Gracilibacteria bacterium]|nr:hypothetical protein [Candidatus Gracilibacteria bacterium]